jgi:MerR HTH family regulatory protein
MQDRFRSREVVAFTGVKARRLQWWDERGMVIPARKRNRRLNTTRHLSEVAVLCHCQRKGFLLQSVKKGMRFLMGNLGKRAAEIVDRGSEYYLLTHGTHLYLGVLGEEDRGHPEKFEPVDSGYLSERGRYGRFDRDSLRKSEYFGNVA